MSLMTMGAAAWQHGSATGGDPHWASVVSLLHFDDPLDQWKDEKGVMWTAVGTPVLDSTNKRFGTSSLGLNGSSHLAASISGFAFGTDDYTLEAWFRNAGNSNKGIFSNVLSGTHNGSIGAAIESSNNIFVQNNNTATTVSATTTGGFLHLALVRREGVLRAFMQGVRVFQVADTRNLTAESFYLGGYFSTSYRMVGNIDEFRATAAVSRYWNDFTPPSGPFPNYGT